jgi:hypothetical protein
MNLNTFINSPTMFTYPFATAVITGLWQALKSTGVDFLSQTWVGWVLSALIGLALNALDEWTTVDALDTNEKRVRALYAVFNAIILALGVTAVVEPQVEQLTQQ